MIKTLAKTLVVASMLFTGTAFSTAEANNDNATISITLKEYEKLKEAVEAERKDQYWKMPWEQILEKKKPKVVKPPKHKQTIAKLTEFNEDD